MRFVHRPINHEDERGTIRDIFPNGAPDSVTVIYTHRGGVRGNHLHKLSTQHLYVVSGRLSVFTQSDHGGPEQRPLRHHVAVAGDLLSHPPLEAHAYMALEDTVFLAFADGVRKGESYEDDTHRVPSLIDAWETVHRVKVTATAPWAKQPAGTSYVKQTAAHAAPVASEIHQDGQKDDPR